MDLDLSGRVSVVTGAAPGIGRASALRLAAEGAGVFALDRDFSSADQTADSGRASITSVKCELCDELPVAGVFRSIGPLELVCANAGLGGDGTLGELGLDEWPGVFSTNGDSVIVALREALRSMPYASGGSLIIGSVGGCLAGHPTSTPAYGASKAAVAQLIRLVAARAAPAGICANVLCPGPVDTRFAGRANSDPINVPLGRKASPDEIADIAAFLLSPRAAYIIGPVIVADGDLAIVLSLSPSGPDGPLSCPGSGSLSQVVGLPKLSVPSSWRCCSDD